MYSSFSYCTHSSVYQIFWPSDRVVDCNILILFRHSTPDIQNYAYIRLSEAVPMRPFFRVKNGGRWRMNHTRGRNLRGKCIVYLFDLTD